MSTTKADITTAIAALQKRLSSEPRASNPRLVVDEFPTEVWSCIVPLAMDKIGCRVIQSALNDADNSCRVAIARAFRGHVLRAIRCQNANHVIQRVIELVAPESVQFIVFEICEDNNPGFIARHPFGCRVFERLLEHFPPVLLSDLIECALEDILDLCGDPYGTYVVQHIFEHGIVTHKVSVVETLLPHLKWMALDANAVGVLESALYYSPLESQVTIANAIAEYDGLLCEMTTTRQGHSVAMRIGRILPYLELNMPKAYKTQKSLPYRKARAHPSPASLKPGK